MTKTKDDKWWAELQGRMAVPPDGAFSITEFRSRLGLSRSAASHRLATLRDKGIVRKVGDFPRNGGGHKAYYVVVKDTEKPKEKS